LKTRNAVAILVFLLSGGTFVSVGTYAVIESSVVYAAFVFGGLVALCALVLIGLLTAPSA